MLKTESNKKTYSHEGFDDFFLSFRFKQYEFVFAEKCAKMMIVQMLIDKFPYRNDTNKLIRTIYQQHNIYKYHNLIQNEKKKKNL